VTGNRGAGAGKGEHDSGSPHTWTDAGGFLGEGIGLVFTDRHGGVSSAPYDTLNLAFHTGDGRADVVRNRMAVSRGLGIAPRAFVYLEQVHGICVARVDAPPEEAGEPFPPAICGVDGACTSVRGLALAVLTADCVPIAIADPTRRVIAMVHAGWKGTISDITATALREMEVSHGVDPSRALAVLGPAIRPCCYEVDEGRARLFVERYGKNSGVAVGKMGRSLDLVKANRLNLLHAGVREENILAVGGCTCCDGRYFSFRRDGVTGRQGAFIFLRG
jgi:purine-nucleoside/S-methyl-5'-thioadenosine phosphorylase / adenosine deaminase